jgi:hypothetical protein
VIRTLNQKEAMDLRSHTDEKRVEAAEKEEL